MKTKQEIYRKWVMNICFIWAIIFLAQFLGLNFGLEVRTFSLILGFIFLSLGVEEVWVKRKEIGFFLKQKREVFFVKVAQTKEVKQWRISGMAAIYVMIKETLHFFKETVTGQGLLFLFFAMGIFGDIFYWLKNSDLRTLVLFGIWIILARRYKFEGRAAVSVALGFLILCPILLVFNNDVSAEKSAIWVYMFLLIGVIQMFWETRKEPLNPMESDFSSE